MHRLLEEAVLPLESVVLLVAGIAMLLAGVLLFPVIAGMLPYYENGLLGLLLFMYALQMITLGKTPFGDRPKSKWLMAAGVATAALGFVTCFIPGVSSQISRWLLFLCLGPGSVLLLWQLYANEDKYAAWVKYGGVFKTLLYSCAVVYVLSICLAAVIWEPTVLAAPLIAVLLLLYGAALLNLALVLRRVYRDYPAAEQQSLERGLSMDKASMLLVGVFVASLGVVMLPVNLQLLPFSGSAQLGLLMVIFAVKILATGSTPLGAFRRTWLMILLGVLVVIPGVVSCIIPEILVFELTLLIGVLNVLEGIITLVKTLTTVLKQPSFDLKTTPAIFIKLFVTQMALGVLAVLFGSSMLIAHLIPGLLVGLILIGNGGVLLYLLKLLGDLEKLEAESLG